MLNLKTLIESRIDYLSREIRTCEIKGDCKEIAKVLNDMLFMNRNILSQIKEIENGN